MTLHNPSKLNISLKMTILSLLMTSLLAGCGIRGSLKTPPPLFGGGTKVDVERVPTEDLGGEDTDDFDLLDDDIVDDDIVDDDTLADF